MVGRELVLDNEPFKCGVMSNNPPIGIAGSSEEFLRRRLAAAPYFDWAVINAITNAQDFRRWVCRIDVATDLF